MEPEQGGSSPPEASRLNRRQYLLSTGALASGLLTAGQSTAASDSDISVDVTTSSVNHDWKTVQLTNTYSEPVVIAPTLSYSGNNPASPRVRNVSEAEFELSVEEWMYLDGGHLHESIGSFVTNAGVYDPTDGTTFEIDTTRTDHQWTSVSFSGSFSETPVVFTNAQTVNGHQPIVTRNGAVDTSGMKVRLQEEENQGPHRAEDVGYLAVAAGTGQIAGRAAEAGTAEAVDHRWQQISFSQSYEEPTFLADLQTYRGHNPVTVRYRNLSGSSVEVKLQEERSATREMGHVGERVGYLVVEREPAPAEGFGLGGFGEGGYGQ